MDKVRRDRRKDIHTRLDFGDFGEDHRERTREDSHHSSARDRTTKPERLKVQDRLRYGDRHVLDRLGHRRQSAFDRLSETYSLSTTKSRPRGTDSRDHPRGRRRPHRLDTSKEDRPKDRERFRRVGELYDDSFSHSYRDGNRSRHMKRRRDNESPLFSVSRSDSRAPNVWFDELPPESIDNYKDLKAAFLAYFMQQKKYVKDSVEIHNIKQKDGETIEDFMERFKVKTGRMKGAPEYNGRNDDNHHCLHIRRSCCCQQKKGHALWKAHDQSKRQNSDKKSDFRSHSREGRGSNRFTPLTRTPKEILVAEAGKFQPPPPPMSKTGKNETTAKDKPTTIYMIQSWKRTTRQKVTQSFKRVKEIMFPPLAASSGTEGPLVIEVEMSGHMIHRMYVDCGSSMEILYEHCFNRLQPEIKSQMVPATTSLTGFSGETIWPLGQLRLLVIIGDANHSTRAWMNFRIVRKLSPYNGIIGRPGIRAIQAVPSTVHGMLKFPVVSKEERTRPDSFKVALHPDFPDQEVAIGGTLSDKGRIELCSILKKNLDIFAWQPSDMTGVSRSVAEHRLNIREGYSSVRQKKIGHAPERAKAIQAEVQKLVEAGIMREVYYHDWLSNPVMVKKHDGSWRMCDDFTDLNKAYAYKGYHQIQLAEPDKEKTTFHTRQGVYCYTKMPFGLKNAGATYQRRMDKAFESQISQNIEVYVDDLVVKRVFLGYVVTPDGIKLCPHKTADVLQLPSPRTIKKVQSLNGKLGLELNYTPMEKLVLSLVFATKRLRRYFQAHPITVITDQPTKQIMSHPDVAGRLQKWSIMLGEHNITYMPRTSVKGQILADFLIEMPGENPQAAPEAETQQESWTLFTDGSSCVDGSGVGLILTNLEGIEFTYALRFHFAASNNEAEYEALIAGLRIVARMKVKNVHVSVDSKLVANQVLGTYVAKEDNMVKYLDKVKGLEVATVVEEDGPTWMTSIVEYLKEGTLPIDKNEARKLCIKARRYELMEGILYRRSFLTSWLRCVGPLQAEYVVREIHEGSCSMHAGPRSVVAKAIRLRYYWPTMHKDVRDMIRKCNDCQIHRPITRSPQQPLTPITAPWPFYKWGIDISGPFP
nr:reverse transcriptase domain-containing protein [Tanacetum cinerariifolium]